MSRLKLFSSIWAAQSKFRKAQSIKKGICRVMKWVLSRNDVKNPLAKMLRENSGLLKFQDYLVLKTNFNEKSFLWPHLNPPSAISNTIFLLLLLFFMIAFNIFYFEQLSDKNNNKITISAERKLRKHENENCWKENFASRWQRNKVRE